MRFRCLLSVFLVISLGCTKEQFYKTIFHATYNLKTPKVVPEKKLAVSDVYRIRTRIVIEGIKMQDTLRWTRELNQIRQELKNAETIYADIGLKFIVVEICYRLYNPQVGNHFIEATKYDNAMTVVYMLPNTFPYNGLSCGPWEKIMGLSSVSMLTHGLWHMKSGIILGFYMSLQMTC